MRKTLFTCLLGAFALQAAAQVTPLDGFAYSDIVQAPTGKEWESPEQLSLNKEQPHASRSSGKQYLLEVAQWRVAFPLGGKPR